MDEYLFFQKHKDYLKNNSSILTPQILSKKVGDLDNRTSSMRSSMTSGMSLNDQQAESIFMPKQKAEPYIDKKFGKVVNPDAELNNESMQGNLKSISGKYNEHYEKSGYPPKICTLILKELVQSNKLKCQILDIGCGKGQIGQYLREDGFLHITGMDCSKNLLKDAQEKKAYKQLEKVVFGQDETNPDHIGKYDVVISATMINNDGWDKSTFEKLLSYAKMGGFIIFTTKMNINQENDYGHHIDELSNEQHWKFVTEHTFYRYDKLCGKQGKFSNKLVKVLAYQKTDHNEYLIREKDRLEREAAEELERKEEQERLIRLKDQKINGAAIQRAARKKQMEDMKQAEIDAEEKTQKELEEKEEQEKQDAIKRKERQAMMMKKLKTFMQNAMWIKLKAIKKAEEERIEALRAEAEVKRKQTVLLRKQTMLLKKVPYDSDEEAGENVKSPLNFMQKPNILDQKFPA